MARLTRIQTRFVRQPDSGRKRAWYQCAEAGLVLELDVSSGRVLSLEVDGSDGSWVCWDPERGLRTGRLDSGGTSFALTHPGSRLLARDAVADGDRVTAARRLVRDAEMAEDLRCSVLARLAV